jgi:curved DNA-binding protein CbpA
MNAYAVLQVSPQADAEIIRAAYRSLMQRYHPDRNPGDQQAAVMAVRVGQAYEILSNPERKAAYDLQLLREQAEPSPKVDRLAAIRTAQRGKVNTPAQTKTRTHWILMGIALLLGVCIIWLFMSSSPLTFSGSKPTQQLIEIRQQMSQATTTESQRRQLYARKQQLMENHSELAREDSAARVDDLAARSFALLTEPLTLRLEPTIGTELMNLRIVLPEITLLLGSFDSANMKDRLIKHRARIVSDLVQSFSKQPLAFSNNANAENVVRALIRKSVMSSLDIRADEEFPTTYFESPGRYGITDVILPQGYIAAK